MSKIFRLNFLKARNFLMQKIKENFFKEILV